MNRVEKVRKKIQLVRIEKGYSQWYVGEQLGISQIAYHKLEKGKTSLKVKTLLDLTEILEIDINSLFNFED